MASGTIVSSNNLHKVFINCPFDDEYSTLLRPLLFTIIYLGFSPLIASQSADSGEVRIIKILELIEQSGLSIHDISRVQAKNAGDYFRLNMPFELGIDWGYRHFKKNNKHFLVLEASSHSASRALSDFSGCDPQNHKNDPQQLVRVVRNWLTPFSSKRNKPGGSHIWDQYNFFNTSLYNKEEHSNEDIEKMPISELIRHIQKWVRNKKEAVN
jgi:hypothetical protein